VEKENWPQEQAYVRSERDTLTFERGTAHWFDVEVFERKASDGLEGSLPCDEARAQDLREALELYQGDLLEGCYDDWCLADRERLNLLLLRVLKKLQQHARLSGDFEMGKEYGERLLSLDSLQEDVHRELMRCYVDAGDPTRALEHFHRCREMLKAELQVEPMRETWRLYREIRADREGLVSTELETSPLTSLEAALVQFDRALVALRHVHEALRVAAAESGLAHGAASVPPVYPKRD
jgi:DNA-binding SARP family transcriptional activator